MWSHIYMFLIISSVAKVYIKDSPSDKASDDLIVLLLKEWN